MKCYRVFLNGSFDKRHCVSSTGWVDLSIGFWMDDRMCNTTSSAYSYTWTWGGSCSRLTSWSELRSGPKSPGFSSQWDTSSSQAPRTSRRGWGFRNYIRLQLCRATWHHVAPRRSASAKRLHVQIAVPARPAVELAPVEDLEWDVECDLSSGFIYTNPDFELFCDPMWLVWDLHWFPTKIPKKLYMGIMGNVFSTADEFPMSKTTRSNAIHWHILQCGAPVR